MEIKAKLNYLHIAPRKVRLVADLIRGMDVKRAKLELENLPKRSAGPVLKLLNSAVANAGHNFHLENNALYVKSIKVDGGPILKRSMPRAFGRAAMIRHRTSHVSIVLDGRDMRGAEGGKTAAGTKPVIKDAAEIRLEAGRKSAERKQREKMRAQKPDGKLKSPPAGFGRKIFRRKVV